MLAPASLARPAAARLCSKLGGRLAGYTDEAGWARLVAWLGRAEHLVAGECGVGKEGAVTAWLNTRLKVAPANTKCADVVWRESCMSTPGRG